MDEAMVVEAKVGEAMVVEAKVGETVVGEAAADEAMADVTVLLVWAIARYTHTAAATATHLPTAIVSMLQMNRVVN
jgi:hypothetical protein